MTSLMGASQNGYIEVVKLLLEQKEIDVNAENNDGKTAILLAAQKNRTEILEILKNHEGIVYDEQIIAEEKRPKGFSFGRINNTSANPNNNNAPPRFGFGNTTSGNGFGSSSLKHLHSSTAEEKKPTEFSSDDDVLD